MQDWLLLLPDHCDPENPRGRAANLLTPIKPDSAPQFSGRLPTGGPVPWRWDSILTAPFFWGGCRTRRKHVIRLRAVSDPRFGLDSPKEFFNDSSE
jgi:hypothetical protein